MKRRPKLAAALLLATCCLPPAAGAELRAGYGNWSYDLEGTVKDGNKTYDFQKDLELERTDRGSLQVQWDTGPGGWPDLGANFSKLGATGHHEETVTSFPLPPTTVTIDAVADFRDLDVTASYPLHSGKLNLSLGLTLKRLTGEVTITDTSRPPPRHENYGETFPELYAAFRWPLTSWLALDAAGQGVSYSGSRATEWRASAELRLFSRLRLEGGWQQKAYKIDVGDYALDATLSGPVVRAGFAFGAGAPRQD